MKISPRINLSLEVLPKEGAREELHGLKIDYGFCETPLGRCLLGESRGRVCYLAFVPAFRDSEALADLSNRWPEAILFYDGQKVAQTVKRIFTFPQSGSSAMKLLVRGTEFQILVWRALLEIPYASVVTYAEVAENICKPKATRAVGTAIGANAIAWLIPCHRVVRSDGGIGGYRWGLATKSACLDLEKTALK